MSPRSPHPHPLSIAIEFVEQEKRKKKTKKDPEIVPSCARKTPKKPEKFATKRAQIVPLVMIRTWGIFCDNLSETCDETDQFEEDRMVRWSSLQ